MIDFHEPTAEYASTPLGGHITKQPTASRAASGPSRTTVDKWRRSRRPLSDIWTPCRIRIPPVTWTDLLAKDPEDLDDNEHCTYLFPPAGIQFHFPIGFGSLLREPGVTLGTSRRVQGNEAGSPREVLP